MGKDNKKKDLKLVQRDLKGMVDNHHHQLRKYLANTIDKKHPNQKQDRRRAQFQLDNEYIHMRQ